MELLFILTYLQTDQRESTINGEKLIVTCSRLVAIQFFNYTEFFVHAI